MKHDGFAPHAHLPSLRCPGGRRVGHLLFVSLLLGTTLPHLTACHDQTSPATGDADSLTAPADSLRADSLALATDTARLRQQKFQLTSEREMRRQGLALTGWRLLAAPSLRVKDLTAMKGRMIVIARAAPSDTLLSRILTDHRLPLDHVYRPQIDDLELRTHMLVEGQIDATLLPSPFAEDAIRLGAKPLLPDTFRLQPDAI